MRKSVGIFIATMFLLVAPVLATAATWVVQGAGNPGVAGNNVTLSGGATNVYTGGINYAYPANGLSTTATLNVAPGYTASVVINGAAPAAKVDDDVLLASTTGGNIKVTFT